MPAYNAARTLRRTYDEVMAQGIVDLIIVVDDASRDATASIAKSLPNAVVHIHEKNRGYGAALRTGFENCSKEYIFYTDGDGQFDSGEIIKLIPLLEKGDVVSAYRVNRKDPWNRILNAWIYNTFLLIFFRLNVKDVDCAFKLYRSKFFDNVTLKSDGALIDAEVLIKLKKAGAKIVQTGVNHYPRLVGEQTGSKFKVILKTAKEILANWRDLA